MPNEPKPLHPGIRVRSEIIPVGVSVSEAAKLIGVGRPALSNFLNGKAALSAEMAIRLEKAFGVPRERLLEMQATYEAAQAKEKNVPAASKSYVPPFLSIKANKIQEWSESNLSARARLSVLLRTLIHSTAEDLSKVSFPGNDDAERPGWDGYAETGRSTPWIPEGRSGWEFGVNKDVKAKADGDFEKSVKALGKEDRDQITFIFVTPRRWAGREQWEAQAKAKKLWKDVRAFDASDLEQWLEQSLPAQAWFAAETNHPAQDVRSLDKCWNDWANVASPPLAGALFASAIDATKRTILSRLSGPSEGPITIAADSVDEALAFLTQLLGSQAGEELASFRDRTIVFDRPGTLPRLAQSAQSFIPVIHTREVEREFAPYAKNTKAFIVYPRNAVTSELDVVLEPASYEAFDKALKEQGRDRDEIERLANESGRSLTVLRRRLAIVEAVRSPQWAVDAEVSRTLIPFLFVGAWHSSVEADRVGLSLIAQDRPYDDLESDIQILSKLDDAPVWSIGAYRGVVSKIDLLFAIAPVITVNDLRRFFSMAQVVLGEDDPSLDLAEDQRWAAAIHGKTREFSGGFRRGVSETLVLLSVHGGTLFKRRLGYDPALHARSVVRDLLKLPLTTRTLAANDQDLPTYAEAAPEEFLSIIQDDLKSEAPAVLGLLRPANSASFGSHPSRTGLLWALEGLAWNPETLPRAALILSRLAQIEIDDNWINKPINSLKAIFSAWMPQTAASLDDRVNLVKKIAEHYPDVAWNICISQFGSYHEVGHYSHKPRWRPDGFGHGEPIQTTAPTMRFRCEMVEMALGWKNHSAKMLIELIERLQGLDDDFQGRVWALIEAWAKGAATDTEKADVREKIRVTALSTRALTRAKKNDRIAALRGRAKLAFQSLEPIDLMNKHAWLFREIWVQESADELDDVDSLDYQKRDQRIQALRVDAMREVRDALGLSGLLTLAQHGKSASQIGFLSSYSLLSDEDTVALLLLAFQRSRSTSTAASSLKALMAGLIQGIIDVERRDQVLTKVGRELSEDDFASVLLLSPFGQASWRLVDALGDPARQKYWTEIRPQWIHYSDLENSDGVERLLRAGRPHAAFSCIRLTPEKFDAQLLFRVLSAAAMSSDEVVAEDRMDQYGLTKVFERIDVDSSLTVDQKAGLEFAYLEALAPMWGESAKKNLLPNLERYIEKHPEIFVQAIVWTYRRRDGVEDPAEFRVPDDRTRYMADRGYKLLEALRRMPGHNDLGELRADRLEGWIVTVRDACSELGRGEAADQHIGHLLAHAPLGADEIWPCEPVRQALENIQSEQIMRGIELGIYNSRGVHWRGEGGAQEREIAERYRRWGEAIRFSFPYVASNLLMSVARRYEHEAQQEDIEAGMRRRLR